MRIIQYTRPATRSLAPLNGFLPRSPWAGFESEIDRLFATALGGFAGASPDRQFPVDLYEDKDNTYVRAELPGVSRDDIGVEVADGCLTLTAVRKIAGAEGKEEESFSLRRSVRVPESVATDRVAAAYENGVLTVTLPKKEEAHPKKITVAVQ